MFCQVETTIKKLFGKKISYGVVEKKIMHLIDLLKLVAAFLGYKE